MEAAEPPEVPEVICVGSDEFRSHLGAAWRAVQAGTILRITDRRSGITLGYITREVPPALLGLEGALPDPHEADDHLGPDDEPEPDPSPWVIREDVAPELDPEAA
jgi:hypothetical protein